MTRPGYRCHECPDRKRLERNCPYPLRTDEWMDSRDLSQPSECDVHDPQYAAVASRFWQAMEHAEIFDRCSPSEVPADAYAWSRVVRHEYQASVQMWSEVEAKRRGGGAGNG